ncbi:MAG: alpha/beta-type small acid-soluble spore protein [Clostridiales bacterium]|nr:alpha/beta-type small acid-soluble spore protein [Clostridiales bacterium]
MSSNNSKSSRNPALDKFKYEVANEVGVNLKEGYNGDLTSRQAGQIGGNMVKKLVKQAEDNLSK